ncbi:formyltransferase family protein [Candidatus Pelagibacter bacterium nBUS_27]|uniref:formyltransferase family protein n=1 Tax=Candidatus Pelagibacter bacterium nBUS_27 TaxID=3374188 RepID=UPI003EC0C3E9
MKITLFTGDNLRHEYFISLLSKRFNEVYVIQEKLPKTSGENYSSKVIKSYFKRVNKSQKKIFGKSLLKSKSQKLKRKLIKFGELSNIDLLSIDSYLKSDVYIVYGSSYIKGNLVDFLIRNRAINIHMGVSPYYRGTDCNFWALNDNNLHLVGSTIHLLSKGLDSGNILYHAMSNHKSNIYDYSMSTVKSAFYSLVERISNKKIFDIKPTKQNKSKEIRYSKNKEFTSKVVRQFMKKKLDITNLNFINKLLTNPYFLKNDD